MVSSTLIWTSQHGRLWQCLFMELQLNILRMILRFALSDILYLYLEASTSHQRQAISDGQETSGSLGRLCRKERLVKMASDRETGALFGKASGWKPDDVYAPANIHQLAKLMVSACPQRMCSRCCSHPNLFLCFHWGHLAPHLEWEDLVFKSGSIFPSL